MTTLILGCGYLGRRVAARLIGRGERVVGTTRSEGKAEALASIGIRAVILDVLESGSEDLPEFDRLVYCVGYGGNRDVPIRSVYVDGLARLLDRLGDREPRFVYASSTGVYGQDDGSTVTEESEAAAETESGRACREAEQVALRRGAMVLRLAGLYGPGRILRAAALKGGQPIEADPDRVVNLVHIDDAAAAVVAALDRGEPGRIYNVADDHPVSRAELYTTTARCLGAPVPTFLRPEVGASAVGANKRVSNRRMTAELGVRLMYPDISSGLPAAVAAESSVA